mmetsp:Transcript_35028/g.62203  ORF Transcript_35028/g.62203 Transcript_35028/m.62203 type:complete len:85 (+) Transcript_35028:73-327(+)
MNVAKKPSALCQSYVESEWTLDLAAWVQLPSSTFPCKGLQMPGHTLAAKQHRGHQRLACASGDPARSRFAGSHHPAVGSMSMAS